MPDDPRRPLFVVCFTPLELVFLSRAVNEAKEACEQDAAVDNPTEVWKDEIATATSIIDKLGEGLMTNQIMEYFEFEHLPAGLKEMSGMVHSLANVIDEVLEDSAEKTAGLRKLLEAKDCFVRALLTQQRKQEAEVAATTPADLRTPDPKDHRYSTEFGTFEYGGRLGEEQPFVYLFSNSKTGNGEAMALAEDGEVLAMASCSSRAYLKWDLHDNPDSLAAARVRSYYAPNYRLYVCPVDDPTPPQEVIDRMWAKMTPPPQGSAMEGELVSIEKLPGDNDPDPMFMDNHDHG